MTEQSSEEQEKFRLLNFDGEEKSNAKPVVPDLPPINTEPIKAKEELKPSSIPVKKEIKSVEDLKPELKNNLKKIDGSISSEKVSKLINEMKNVQTKVFFDQSQDSVFSSLNSKDQEILMKKMSEWEVPEEMSNLNASVILSWLNKTIEKK